VQLLFTVHVSTAWAQVTQRVVDIPTRPGVTQRVVLLSPDNPKLAVILFAAATEDSRLPPAAASNGRR